jgi:peptide-methionine (R)-S-oxide reductase
MITRRGVLLASASAFAAGAAVPLIPALAQTETYEITRTDAEWQALLTDAQYDVLRRRQNETPGSSPLLPERRPGMYHCAGCDLAVYSSVHKYDAKTGWLSFWMSEPDAIRTSIDQSQGYPRREILCRRCRSYFGNIFSDAPRWSAFALMFGLPGRRHSVSGVALTFVPA